jgi:RimJ/RimL family protein N-acetyltransferase
MMMLKGREASFSECEQLFALMLHKKVFPYVRERADSLSEFLFNTRKLVEMEFNRELVTRTILNEYGKPIGCISLFDIQKNEGFLATWLGAEYHGKGYNQAAKEAFFDHLFFVEGIDNIFLKIRKSNARSKKAAEKLPYNLNVNDIRPDIYGEINKIEEIYDLYCVSKLNYFSFKQNEDRVEEVIMA